jgi:hypothetical protein
MEKNHLNKKWKAALSCVRIDFSIYLHMLEKYWI